MNNRRFYPWYRNIGETLAKFAAYTAGLIAVGGGVCLIALAWVASFAIPVLIVVALIKFICG